MRSLADARRCSFRASLSEPGAVAQPPRAAASTQIHKRKKPAQTAMPQGVLRLEVIDDELMLRMRFGRDLAQA